MNILEMGRDDILKLKSDKVEHPLTSHEVVHMAKTLGAFWSYDYEAAKLGRVGMHAMLKSGRHSDGFFVSKILLAHNNILQLVARQMATVLRRLEVFPDYVVGVPDGATKLGETIAHALGTSILRMEKAEGHMLLKIRPLQNKTILIVEDFCTRGTGFIEAVLAVAKVQPYASFWPWNPVIINRGGLSSISVPAMGEFTILPLVEWRVEDWDPTECPLCQMGSVPIKPKATDENWRAITTSQA